MAKWKQGFSLPRGSTLSTRGGNSSQTRPDDEGANWPPDTEISSLRGYSDRVGLTCVCPNLHGRALGRDTPIRIPRRRHSSLLYKQNTAKVTVYYCGIFLVEMWMLYMSKYCPCCFMLDNRTCLHTQVRSCQHPSRRTSSSSSVTIRWKRSGVFHFSHTSRVAVAI